MELIKTLSQAGGGEGMIGGQIRDLETDGKPLSLEELQQIHLCKTSALLEAAFAFGGIIAQAKPEEIQRLKQFGKTVGLIYQIIDDTLDVKSDKHKSTYATLLGVEKALSLAQDLHHSALSLLSDLPYDTYLLKVLAEVMIKRKK